MKSANWFVFNMVITFPNILFGVIYLLAGFDKWFEFFMIWHICMAICAAQFWCWWRAFK